MKKLAIRDSILEVLGFLWTNRPDLFRMIAAPVLALSVINTAVAALLPKPETPTTELQTAATISTALLIGVSFVFYVMFAVAWHRRCLKPEEQTTIWTALRWDKRKTQFMTRSLVIAIILITVAVSVGVIVTIVGGGIGLVSTVGTGATGKAVPTLLGAIGTLIIVVLVFLMNSRLALWLPAAAVDDNLTLMETWVLARGNTWRIFAVVLLASAPGILFFFVVDMAVKVATQSLGMGDTLTFRLIASLALNLANYIVIAIGVSALSTVYRELRHPTSPGMPYYT
jgi:hypothetical protein